MAAARGNHDAKGRFQEPKARRGRKDAPRGKLFTGVAIDYSPSGAVAWETSYVDGIEDGATVGWYDNGTLKAEEFYQIGCLRGISRE
jgi:antitoxin component YwqK of YwqJK toxin-antitoxin module